MRRFALGAILLAVIIASLALNLYQYSSVRSITVTTTTVNTITTTVNTITTTVVTITTTVVTNEIIGCKSILSSNSGLFYERPLPLGTLITTSPKESASICVRFYYYNLGNPILLIPLNAIQLQSANFTVSAEPANISIGGVDSLNEGAIVEYHILAKPGTSGTYDLGFSGGGE